MSWCTVTGDGRSREGRRAAGAFCLFAFFLPGVGGFALEEKEVVAPGKATFHEHIVPILKRSCLGCHGGRKPKGKYSMESLEQLLAGSERGRTIVPGKPSKSLLFRMISGKEKLLMPPRKAEPLSEGDILTIGAWIRGGAKAGKPPALPRPYSLPPAVQVYSRPPVITSVLFDRAGENLFISGYREVLVHGVEALLAAGKEKKKPPVVQPARRFTGEAERIQAMALSGDGRLLAVAAGSPGRFGEVQLWDIREARMTRFRRMGRDVLYSVDFSPDGARLVVGGTDRSLHVLGTDGLELQYSAEVHSDWILSVTFCVGGKRLLSCGRDRTIRALAAGDGKLLKTLATFDGAVTRVVERPGFAQVLAAGEKMEPRIYDVEGLREIRKLEMQPGPVFAAAFSADGKRLALAGSAGELRTYEADTGKRLSSLSSGPGWIYSVAFDASGKRLAAGGYEGTVCMWDIESGRKTAEIIPVPLEGAEK